jgi:two-component system chemotaxis response regulator CheY
VRELPKVLIVDDAAFMRMSIRNMLEKNGFEIVDEASNGMIGVMKYMEHQPDVVTMDITMPEMGGLEALQAIREYDPKAKVVMVSAMGQETMVKQAIAFGAKSFILKPFKEDQVVEILFKVANI